MGKNLQKCGSSIKNNVKHTIMIGGLSNNGIEKEFEFWAAHDVDFIMLSVAYDFFLNREKISEALRLKDKYSLNLLIHPRPDGNIFQTPANIEAHSIMLDSLDKIRDIIYQNGLINKLILHLSSCRLPGNNFRTFSEEEAISNSLLFYKHLRQFNDLTFVFENVYPPGIGWEELGYVPEHFSIFNLPKNSEFCLDTGHLKLSTMNMSDIFRLPYKITCLHLHSNNGRSDQHIPLTRQNFHEWREVEEILTYDKYIVLEVKNELDKVKNTIEYIKKNQIAP